MLAGRIESSSFPVLKLEPDLLANLTERFGAKEVHNAKANYLHWG